MGEPGGSSSGPAGRELAESLLEELRRGLGRPAISYAEAPEHLTDGGEAVIYGFRLAGAEAALTAPLILRLLRPSADPTQVRCEEAVHGALHDLGFPVPGVVLAHEACEPLGAPFVVLERVPGRMLLEDVRRPTEFLRHPLRLPGLVADALVRVPKLLAGLQARLHSLDPEPVRRAVVEAGLDAHDLTPAGRLDEIEQRTRAASVPGLETGLRWLREHLPPIPKPAICHGDFVFTNVCVDRGNVTGVLDWSDVALADPGERLGEGRRFSGAIEERWLHPSAIALGVARFQEITGVELQPALARRTT